jgi:hypothetical protein
MPDRTLNFGDGETEATYQIQDTDAANGGGDFVLVGDLANSVERLLWDPVAEEFVVANPVRIDGDLAATLPDLNDTIDLIQVADADALPDPANVTQPTIAYLDAEDDYVGVFQA